MNFLLSESTKLNPTILYLTNDNSSEIYIKALEGSWNEAKLGAGFLNPFICKNSETENKYIKDIFKILLSKEDTKPEQKIVDLIADFILKQPPEQRNLQYLQDNFDFETLKAEYYKELLARIIKEDSIANLVNMQQDIALELNSVVAFNLKEITEMDYESKNFPSDPKLRSAYIDKIEALNKVRSIILLSLIHKFINLDPITPKILVIDNFFHLLDTIDSNLMNELLEALNSANGIILTAVNTADHDKLLKLASWKVFYDKLATKMILSSEVVLDDLDKLLELSRLELKKLKTLKPLKRLFMIKQMNNTIVTELSLGGLPGVLKLLSAKESEVKAAFSIIEQKGPAAGDWLEEVYENFTKQE
jgi:type IV secretion system protein VirB4